MNTRAQHLIDRLPVYVMLRDDDDDGFHHPGPARALELGGPVSQRRVIDAEEDQWVKLTDLVGLLLDVPLHAEADQGWRPIETAPKDGTLIIGALIRDGKVWRVHDMKYNSFAFYTRAGGSVPQMTHWMPLPSFPPLSARCDHKFSDSTSCLTCGWTPEARV